MRSTAKNIFSVILILVAAAAAFYGSSYYKTEKILDEDDCFYFYSDGEYSDSALSTAEINEYESKYADYGSDMYYNSLGESEKIIYNVVVYAFENSESCVFIPEGLIPSGDFSLTDILYFVALDSPLIEQNIAFCDESDTNDIYLNDILGIKHTRQISGTYLFIDNFTEERLNNKLLAIDEAQEIIASIPSDADDEEKLEYLFNTLADSSDYVEYDYETLPEFLYDTLVNHGSNCDGFTNSYSLLCNMLGIDCFEKMKNADETESGHTWNCVYLNGKYYNVDVTGAVDSEEDTHPETYLFYPDRYSFYDAEYSDYIPSCTDASLSAFDCEFTSEGDRQIAKTLVSEFNANGGEYVCAFFSDMTEERLDRITDLFVEAAGVSIMYYTDEPVGGKICLVCFMPRMSFK